MATAFQTRMEQRQKWQKVQGAGFALQCLVASAFGGIHQHPRGLASAMLIKSKTALPTFLDLLDTGYRHKRLIKVIASFCT